MKIPGAEKILVAVSGGSDSVSLLHRLVQENKYPLAAATVDHGLRKESALEAEFVSTLCGTLNIPHTVLKWTDGQPRQEDARHARFELLAEHARVIGTKTIALGHTMDDQAETIVMRARRSTHTSDTRGLSGIPSRATYEELNLLRPLLNATREELRDELRAQNIDWIDDPSNQNTRFERVRTRNWMADTANIPTKQQIAELGHLATRHRSWMNALAARMIDNHAQMDGSKLTFEPPANTPVPIVASALSILIQTMGGGSHRVPKEKFERVVAAWQSQNHTRQNAGRTLISVKNDRFLVERERRNTPELPENPKQNTIYDNRLRFYETNGKLALEPFIVAFERFRPACDDIVYDAVMRLLRPSRST